MRLLLLQNMLYVPTLGGANKANRLLLEELVLRGHTCKVIVPAIGSHGPQSLSEFAHELAIRRIEVRSESAEACVFEYRGVEVHAVLKPEHLYGYAFNQVTLSTPDLIMVSSQDPGQLLLAAGLKAGVAPLVYLLHCPLDLPFGPHSIFKSAATTRLIERVHGIITVSAFMRDYILRWAGLNSSVLRFPVYGSGPFKNLASFDRGFVTFINPCANKGMSIFVKLVELFPGVEFCAIPAWGTTETDYARLKTLANVTILEPSENIETILAKTRLLLVPSLWPEAFGIVVVEAMLRGIPVIASNVGGLAEAKLGVDHILPVHPIDCYQSCFDSGGFPNPVIPDQDIIPWRDTLHDLLTQRQQFCALSEASRTATLNFVSRIDVNDFENFFASASRGSLLRSKPQKQDSRVLNTMAESQTHLPKNLSPEKRTLLALRALKTRQADVRNPS